MNDINVKQINLWNESSENNTKTKNVIEYIKMLYPHRNMDEQQRVRFEGIKTQALQLTTANDMLERIGYRFRQSDTIFKEAWSEE